MPQPEVPKAPPNLKLRAAREALPSPSGAPDMCMTRRELAEAANDYVWRHTGRQTNLSERDIGRYERGEAHWPDHWRRYGLRGVLRVDSDTDLGLYPNRRSTRIETTTPTSTPTAMAVIVDWGPVPQLPLDLPRRSLLAAVAAVAASCGLLGKEGRRRRLGSGDVERIRAVTILYRSIDYEYGGGMLYTEVSKFAEAAAGLLDQTYSETLAPRLLAAIAAVRQLAGWAAFDSCRHSDAQRHFLAAERGAVTADDPLLAARVRYCQARQYQHLRHNRDALDSLRLAREHLGTRATAAVGAMLDGAEAASLAALGDGEQARALLGRASDGFGGIEIDREPDWMHFYDRGELLAQYGRVYRDLARVNRRYGQDAVEYTTDAIRAFSPQNARSNVLNQVGLCSALFLAGEPEHAVAVGTRAIEQARGLASPRLSERLRNVRHDLAGNQNAPEVTDLTHALASLGRG